MKQFKTIDFWINTGLIISSIIICILEKVNSLIDETILVCYFIVGSWQAISMLVHVYNKCFTKKWGSRNIYHWITFIALVTMPCGSFWVLAITAPFMAIYYTWLCYHETYVKMQRPLAILK